MDNLPHWVRPFRDEVAPENSQTRIGYKKFAAKMVPKMEQSAIVRTFVWFLIVNPIIRFSGWKYKEPKYNYNPINHLITVFWLFVWKTYGKKG